MKSEPRASALECGSDPVTWDCRKVFTATAAAAALCVAALAASPASVAAQGSPCDPDIERNSKGGILGYQTRGEHCEGLYATDVAATVMWVASLTETFAEYDLSSTAPLKLSWDATGGVVHLRAHSIKRDIYYRMDNPRDAGSEEWDWPTDFLASQQIEKNDIGVLGWTQQTVDGVDYNLFVPVRVTSPDAGVVAGDGSYELIIVPNVRLEEVYVSLAKVEKVGQHPQAEYIKSHEPLGQRVYATQRPIRIELSGFSETGIYFVEVTATRAAGRPVTMDPMWIYHSGGNQ